MADDQTSISLDLSPTLLSRFDSACEKEFHEPGKRSFKLRDLMREYCKKQGV